MKNFDFNSVPKICFGVGQLSRLPEFSASFGKRALLIHNGASEVPAQAAESLRSAGIDVQTLRQRGEPTLEDVDRAIAACRDGRIEFLIGMGGGSAIDTAKATAGLAPNSGTALDYLEVIGAGKPLAAAPLPWIAVPATAGSGAEATRNAVISSPKHQYKASLRSEKLIAKIALVDPAIGVSVPPATTAASGMDALCQLIESYTSTGANHMTDALATEGMTLVSGALAEAFKDGHDLHARNDMAMGALLGGICLTNAGLGAVHGFAAPLGARTTIPHGMICAILLPHVMRANASALRLSNKAAALKRYSDIGWLITGDANRVEKNAIDAGVEWVENLVRDLKIGRLSDFGFKESQIDEIVPLAKKASSMKFNPAQFEEKDLAAILRAAL